MLAPAADDAALPGAARGRQNRAGAGHRSAPPRRTASAISKSGHTRAGRVRQKSHKQAEMVSAGQLRCRPLGLAGLVALVCVDACCMFW